MKDLRWTTEHMPELSGKIIVVTGGNSGLGYESVKAFAMKGAEVVLASRSTEKGEAAKAEILKAIPDGKIKVTQLDLGDLDSVRSFATAFIENYKKLDVLLNNAGIMMTPYFTTKDGFEGQIGTNHLEGKFLFKILTPLFKRMAQDPAMGALPQIRASVDPGVKGSEYYGPDGKREFKGYPVVVQSNEASHHLKDAAQLWEESVKLTGVTFNI